MTHSLRPSSEESHDTTSEHHASDGVDELLVGAVDHFFVEQEFVCEELEERSGKFCLFVWFIGRGGEEGRGKRSIG